MCWSNSTNLKITFNLSMLSLVIVAIWVISSLLIFFWPLMRKNLRNFLSWNLFDLTQNSFNTESKRWTWNVTNRIFSEMFDISRFLNCSKEWISDSFSIRAEKKIAMMKNRWSWCSDEKFPINFIWCLKICSNGFFGQLYCPRGC